VVPREEFKASRPVVDEGLFYFDLSFTLENDIPGGQQ